jgi:hypothetical protein
MVVITIISIDFLEYSLIRFNEISPIMKKLLKIAAIMAIIGIITALIVYFFVYNKPHPDYARAKAKYTLEAAELYQAYKSGDAEAAKRFTGAVVRIKGTVQKVESVDSLAIAVMVFDEGIFGDEGIRCTMLPELTQATQNLSQGQQVKIKGLCTGFNDTDVILEHCSLSEN